MQTRGDLIPQPEIVRAELARSVRETRRLRRLLDVAIQAEDDARYIDALRHHATTPQTETARPGEVTRA
jgi:hypothetical protein